MFKDIVQIGGREVNMINTLSKMNLSEIGWEGGGSTSIWIMSLNILFFLEYPKVTYDIFYMMIAIYYMLSVTRYL